MRDRAHKTTFAVVFYVTLKSPKGDVRSGFECIMRDRAPARRPHPQDHLSVSIAVE